MEPPSHLFVRERARLLVLFPRSVPFRTKNLGEFGENCPIYKSELRINVTSEYLFLWARPMHQGGRNGATKPLFRARKGALTSVVSKVRSCSNKKFGVKFGEKCPIYKTELRINVPGAYLFFWARPMHQGGRIGATKPLFRARKDALTSVVSKVRLFKQKNWGKCAEKCPIYKTEFHINVPGEYFFLGSANAPRQTRERNGQTS